MCSYNNDDLVKYQQTLRVPTLTRLQYNNII